MKKLLAVLIIIPLVLSLNGCQRQEPAWRFAEVVEELHDLVDIYVDAQANNYSAFQGLYTANTSEEIIERDFEKDIVFGFYDRHITYVYEVEDDMALTVIFSYRIVSENHTSSNWVYMVTRKVDGQWRIDGSEQAQAWADDAFQIVFSEQALQAPREKRWHNRNPVTVTGFVIPQSVQMEIAEIYVDENGDYAIRIFFSNGHRRQVTFVDFSKFIITQNDEQLVDLTGMNMNFSLSRNTSVYRTITVDKEDMSFDFQQDFGWNIGINFRS